MENKIIDSIYDIAVNEQFTTGILQKPVIY